jgi:transcriptional regulator with XRE-family HTH domain
VLRDVGRRIAEMRHSRGWTQEQFAELYGRNPAQIGVLESGGANLTLRTLTRVASLLGVDPRELLEAPKTRAQRRPGRPRKD